MYKKVGSTLLVALIGALASAATCYKSDAPNQQNCSTANVDYCTATLTVGDDGQSGTVDGICTDDVNKDALTTTVTGKARTTGVTCQCTCKYVVNNVEKTKSSPVSGKTYEKLQTANCSP